MPETTLAVTALLMGLVGGPHCLAMCGAACGAVALPPTQPGVGARSLSNGCILAFQLGRILGYCLLGAAAAASMQGLGWLSAQSAVLRPLWTAFHAASACLGLALLLTARQPAWFEVCARTVWRLVRNLAPKSPFATGSTHNCAAPLLMGALWSLLPCGLLYSALLVAAMSANVVQGATVMALFAAGSGITLTAGTVLWVKLVRRQPVQSRIHMRLVKARQALAMRGAGLALFAMSAWALWMGLAHGAAPWCVAR